jgi:methylenetetrahydrofolate dehydrogenase (NADP+)/methenyltetrahydrofolate cyclohydrolase
MLIDGKTIAASLRETLVLSFGTLDTPARVRVFVLSEDTATKQYIGIKERVGTSLGVQITIERLPEDTTTQELIDAIHLAEKDAEGIIVQLPLPPQIDSEKIRTAMSRSKDIDCLGTAAYNDFENGTGIIMPPVIAAFEHIIRQERIPLEGKKVLIIGKGKLVGAPAAVWFDRQGADIDIADAATKDIAALSNDADIIVLGAGVPGLLKPEMIKDGVVIFDAGASESSGKVVGDADPACATKASLFTPVPGGIGPVAIAMLFSNLYTLATDVPQDDVRSITL